MGAAPWGGRAVADLVALTVVLMIVGFVLVRRDRAVPAYVLFSTIMAIYAVVAVREASSPSTS